MAVQTAFALIDEAELELMVTHPDEAFIRGYATQVLGDAGRAEIWLKSEIPSLGYPPASWT